MIVEDQLALFRAPETPAVQGGPSSALRASPGTGTGTGTGSAEAARRAARRGYLRHKLKDGMRRLPHLAMEMDLASGVRDFSEVGRAEQRKAVLLLAPKVIEACEMMRLAWDDVPDLLDEELFPECKTSKRIGTRSDKGHTGDLFAIASESGVPFGADAVSENGTPADSFFAPVEPAAAPPPSRFAPMNLMTTKEERNDLMKNPPPKKLKSSR